jgi:uncharacterized protein (DUF362 family)
MKNRRDFLQDILKWPPCTGLALAAAACRAPQDVTQKAGLEIQHWTPSAYRKPLRSHVAILKAPGYSSTHIMESIRRGFDLCGLKIKGLRVLLKPNLVEGDSQGLINTHANVVAAAIEVLRSLGAAEVKVGEGCGHQRDIEYILEVSGLLDLLAAMKVPFVDLNLDDVSPVPLKSFYMGLRKLYFPDALRQFDLIISMPKMKTHHWVGVTLSMKNLFGLVPGRIYGWPKSFLHMHDIGRSIIDINSTVPAGFAIVDGIIGMQGNGPIQGDAKAMGILVMGSDLVAVDATCCRLMGIAPELIEYLQMAGSFLGNLRHQDIEQRGESVKALASPFELPPGFESLYRSNSPS